MESLSYLEIFRQRWLAIAIAVMLGVGSATLIAFSITPTYTATATLFLSVKDSSATLAERSQFSLARVNSYTDLVRSSDVLQPVIDELGLSMSVQQLAARVTAANPNSTVNIDISAQANAAQSASDIANAVADSLSSLVASVENFGTFSVSLDRLIPAFTPTSPSAPQKNVIIGLGLISGLAVGAIAALLLARFDRRIRLVRDVRRATGLPVLGAIPRRMRSRKHDDTEPVMEAAMADAILRIRQANGGGVARMLLLVPAGRKSAPPQVRLALTAAIAATGRDVVLVETEPTTDQSSPLSEFANNEGLTELLDEKATLAEVARTLCSTGGRVLPVGVATPTEAQAEKSFRSVMTQLLSDAQVVITQTTPSTRPANIPLVAPYADVSIIIARHNRSTDIDLAQAVSQLRIVGVHPIGVVIIDVPRARHIDLSSTWKPDDFAAKPAKALITPRRKATRTTAATKRALVAPERVETAQVPHPVSADGSIEELDFDAPTKRSGDDSETLPSTVAPTVDERVVAD